MIFLEGRQIEFPAVRRDAHPVATPFVRLFPEQFVGDQVKALQRVGGGNIESLGHGTRTNSLHISRLSFFIQTSERNALHEFEAVIHVEHDHAVAAVFEQITNARLGNVEQMSLLLRRESRKRKHCA